MATECGAAIDKSIGSGHGGPSPTLSSGAQRMSRDILLYVLQFCPPMTINDFSYVSIH
jgi:hypothetical protein